MTLTDPTAPGLTLPTQRRVSPLVVVAAVVSLVFIGAAALVASLYAPNGKDASIVTAFVLGTIAPTTVGLLALIRGDHAAIVGQQNARRLVDTANQVEQVAKNVNGHLERHDDLAEKVLQVADTIAASATPLGQLGRADTERTRAEDRAAVELTPTPPDAGTPPLAPDQS